MADDKPRYKWSSPMEWLDEASIGWDAERLRFNMLVLAQKLDSDVLQDEYQYDMEQDGYFIDLNVKDRIAAAVGRLTREQCVDLLKPISMISENDTDSDFELREMIQEYFDDGTLKESDLPVPF